MSADKKVRVKTAPRRKTLGPVFNTTYEPVEDKDIPDGALVIPDYKYDHVLPYIVGEFPEIGNDPERELLLTSFIEASMPGKNLKFAFSKVGPELLKTRLLEKLREHHWNIGGVKEDEVEEYNEFLVSSLVGYIQSLCGAQSPVAPVVTPAPVITPVPQQTDQALIERFVKEVRDEEVIEELTKRSKGQPFMAYYGTSTEHCYVDLSLELLKNARKGLRNPIKLEGCTVYSISELDLKNRVRHECPLCHGVPLVRGVCPVCQHDFSKASLVDKQAIRVGMLSIATSPTLNDTSRLFLLETLKNMQGVPAMVEAAKGQARFDQTWKKLEATGTLPTLILIDDPVVMDSQFKEALRISDAFHRRLPNPGGSHA